ncbi:SRPBCC domain-containing protein [Lewinella sp. IMCC34183]|uniref:SRPBCC domain-containing protein n=1 Tax=Lewinella sp. IMCC34183 TaxID=2248762 RepID=UPI000E274E63|nr:SRPBCC domain-containing protein [Lewinella sp. IMCC34183]
MPLQLSTSIRIQVTPGRIWSILTDFPRYAEWNPFITPATGEATVGSKLNLTIAGTRFRPRVLVADPDRELRWLGSLGIPGIFDGEHYFLLTPQADGSTLLEQGERFRGILVPLLRSKLEKDTRDGFIALNEALRDRAEGASVPV